MCVHSRAVWIMISAPVFTATPNWWGWSNSRSQALIIRLIIADVIQRKVSPIAIVRTPPSRIHGTSYCGAESAANSVSGLARALSRTVVGSSSPKAKNNFWRRRRDMPLAPATDALLSWRAASRTFWASNVTAVEVSAPMPSVPGH